MKIIQTYRFKKDRITYIAPNPPADAEILETMDILTSEDGYEFIRTADGEHLGSSIWLHNGDVVENYIEAKLPETQE